MKLQETSFDLDMSHDDGGIVIGETSREKRGSSTQEKLEKWKRH